jgi:hypothetical protein
MLAAVIIVPESTGSGGRGASTAAQAGSVPQAALAAAQFMLLI